MGTSRRNTDVDQLESERDRDLGQHMCVARITCVANDDGIHALDQGSRR